MFLYNIDCIYKSFLVAKQKNHYSIVFMLIILTSLIRTLTKFKKNFAIQ